MAEPQKTPAGSVLVVGGGIGGVQTALDLADSGYYIYLVEKSPSIGGVMAQLDKTFPTNDCAMCILGPKLVECSRHLNIENITYAELVGLEGEEGAFTARIKKHPRYIDVEKCTGCGECAEVCPVTALSEYDECLVDRKAVYRPFPQASPNVFTIEKLKERRLCELNCPAGCDAQGYIALIAQGKFEEALTLIKETVPLPGVMGRICVHPCEDNCRRNALDESISVAGLKRFAADVVESDDVNPPQGEPKDERVAIVGSGPAGLSCAYYLALAGYRPTIYEALPVAGGMLAVGIPEYRLPRDVLQQEISAIERVGVEIKTNSPIGDERTLDSLFDDGYSAVYVAVGAHRGRAMNVPGEDTPGVMQGVDFLREANLGELSPEEVAGRSVAVIGGGNVAMDAARTAVRLGARDVRVLYRRSQREMPALPEEVSGAVEEGVTMDFLVNPTRFHSSDGRLESMTCVRMQLGEPDESGRRRPEEIPGSEFDLEVDTVIECIGQNVDLSWAEGTGVEHDGWTVEANPTTLATTREGVFAGGDAVTGPWIAVGAVADGRRAAESIRRYLSGEDMEKDREEILTADRAMDDLPPGLPSQSRFAIAEMEGKERASSFAEVVTGYDEDTARAEAERCLDCAICSECKECVKVCEADAIDHEQREEIVDLDVGAVVLCPGFDEFDPDDLYEYGYRRSDNVVTSIEFERILSASGPYGGHLVRPSDGKEPDRIAWIQCIGSRDEQVGCGYCSSVCCTYAVKEAQIAKEHSDWPLHTSIFFMDMRTYGKDFDAYYERGEAEHGIEFVRSRIHEVKEKPDGSLILRYADEEGNIVDEEFDMVVLSVGLRPPRDAEQLAGITGININQYGFCDSGEFEPVSTVRPGVFVSGAFSGPKDIPETVMQASAAAGAVSAALAPARHTATSDKEYPPEIDVVGKPARVGVFVCHCGINIGGVVDVPAVREYTRTLPHVVYAEENLYTCSQDTQEIIREKIIEHDLNRIVVASCTPRTHEPMFQETVRDAGLNKYLFHMANIRDQCSWVHMNDHDAATSKAKALVRSAVAKVVRMEPLPEMSISLHKNAMIIGGGVAGMVSALNLAQQGFGVHLVERDSELGGNARHLRRTLEGRDVQKYLKNLVAEVLDQPLIETHLECEVIDAAGYVGNFTSKLQQADGEVREIEHGAVIIATGGTEYTPQDGEFGSGLNEGVISCRQMEEALDAEDPRMAVADSVAVIHCVGSRNEEHPYCSRVCCSHAIKNAIDLKKRYPRKEIYLLYRDVRTYGFKEEYYRQARQLGVNFVRYDKDDPPKVTNEDGRLRIEAKDHVLGENMIVDVDLIALANGIVPAQGAGELAQLYKVPLNDDRFFLEAHVKLRPVDFATDGVFLAGLAHAPKSLEESIAQAQAAAGRATTLLSQDQLSVEGWVAHVDPDRCSGCGACVDVCAYSATELDEEKGVAVVNEVLCKGCGACTVACRSGAIDTKGYTNEQVLEEVEAICLLGTIPVRI